LWSEEGFFARIARAITHALTLNSFHATSRAFLSAHLSMPAIFASLAQAESINTKGLFGSLFLVHATVPLAICGATNLWYAIPREVATVRALSWATQFAPIAPLGFVNTLAALIPEMTESPVVALANSNHFWFLTSSHRREIRMNFDPGS
jgi:hypothetical protein